MMKQKIKNKKTSQQALNLGCDVKKTETEY